MNLAGVLLDNLLAAHGITRNDPPHYGDDDSTAGTPSHNMKEDGMRPRLGLFKSGNPDLAAEVDEMFGTREWDGTPGTTRNLLKSDDTTMSNNGRTEAIKLVVEVRDWFRNEIEAGDEGLVVHLRRLDKALDLLAGGE